MSSARRSAPAAAPRLVPVVAARAQQVVALRPRADPILSLLVSLAGSSACPRFLYVGVGSMERRRLTPNRPTDPQGFGEQGQ